jgi:hypothetical protein
MISGYAQMMKKKGAMTKKPQKETPAENLERELLTDYEAHSPEVPQGPAAVAGAAVTSLLETRAARKKKIVLRNRTSIPNPSTYISDSVQREEIAISDEEDTEPIGHAHKLLRGWFSPRTNSFTMS